MYLGQEPGENLRKYGSKEHPSLGLNFLILIKSAVGAKSDPATSDIIFLFARLDNRAEGRRYSSIFIDRVARMGDTLTRPSISSETALANTNTIFL